MLDFLFEVISGEDEGDTFFVECRNLTEAREIIKKNFPDGIDVILIGEFLPEEAEDFGYDTY